MGMDEKYFTDLIVVNDKGGKQSDSPCRMDLVPASALLEVSCVLKQGADKYGEDKNWKMIPVDEHLNHAATHIYGYLAGDTSENHLANATCRLLFALQLKLEKDYEESETVYKF